MSDKLKVGDVYRHRRDRSVWKVILRQKEFFWLKISSGGEMPLGHISLINNPYHSYMKWGDRIPSFKQYYNLTKK